MASARFYDRPGIVYVPIVDRPPSYTALAWHPGRLSPQADALVRHVQAQWSFGEGQELIARRPTTDKRGYQQIKIWNFRIAHGGFPERQPSTDPL